MSQIEVPIEETGPLSPQQEAALSGEDSNTTEQTEGENLLAGKFKTQEELEKGYKALESKLGQQPQEQTETTEETPENKTEQSTPDNENVEIYGEAVVTAVNEAGLDLATMQNEYDENGDLSEDSYAAMEKAGYTRATIGAYLRGQQSLANEAQELAEAQVNEVMDSVGGSEEYAKMMAFAQSLPQDVQDQFNAQVSTGDVRDAKLAVMDMHKRFTNEMGSEPSLLEGKISDTQADVYQSHTQLVKDMQTKAYKTDSAERQRVAKKLARSNIFKTG